MWTQAEIEPQAGDGLGAKLVLASLALACVAIPLLVPALVLLVLANLTAATTVHFALATTLIAAALLLSMIPLIRLNDLYVRVAGAGGNGPLDRYLRRGIAAAMALYAAALLLFPQLLPIPGNPLV